MGLFFGRKLNGPIESSTNGAADAEDDSILAKAYESSHQSEAEQHRSAREETKMSWRSQLSKNVKELRFLFCQSSPASSSARSFVEKNYKDLKTLNPKLPILIRECRGTEPQLWVRYDYGVEKGFRLEGLSEEQISSALKDLAKV